MVVVTLIWLAVFNMICLRPIDSGLVQVDQLTLVVIDSGLVHKRTCLSPLRPQVQASVRNFSMRLEPSPHICEKSKSQRSAESRGFPRVLRFPPTGKVDRVR